MAQTGNANDPLPKGTKSLGPQIIQWAHKYIVQPDGEHAGKPWKFTKEQMNFIMRKYALKPDGSWLYPTACLRRSKGWGKTPLLAALCIIEFVGPCRFSHWDKNGNPVGKRVPLPLVQIAATSVDQCGQTMDMLRGMLTESPAEQEFGIDVGKGMIQFNKGPGKIVPVTASSRGLEGGRPTFVRPRWASSCRGRASSLYLMKHITGSPRTRASTSTRSSTAISARLPRLAATT